MKYLVKEYDVETIQNTLQHLQLNANISFEFERLGKSEDFVLHVESGDLDVFSELEPIVEIKEFVDLDIVAIRFSFDSEEELEKQVESHYGWITVECNRSILESDLSDLDGDATTKIIETRPYLEGWDFEFSDQIDVPKNELEYRVVRKNA